ncbi:MAG: exosortase system-associated protein, TIGR04073 family [Verrucomicrobia bacterium]|nr:exosortase system-associated protein, TIGR04073 family [Verrucomicrobiota bacterium]
MKPTLSHRLFAAGLLLAAALVAAPAFCRAQDMESKIQRGFANMMGGIVEIPGCVSDVTRKKGPLMGFSVGLLKGFGMVPVRTAVGLFEFFTFFVPVPANYDPVLKPPTAFNYWDEE